MICSQCNKETARGRLVNDKVVCPRCVKKAERKQVFAITKRIRIGKM